jgi:prolyl-tRNA synthetase
LKKSGLEVLYDDRENKTAGEKFVEADLIGIPFRLVVSEKTLAKDSVELKKRSENKAELIEINKLLPFSYV